jgi:hypothetical protein
MASRNTETVSESVCRLCECTEDNPGDGCEHVFVRRSSWIGLVLRRPYGVEEEPQARRYFSDFVWKGNDYVLFRQVTEEEADALRRGEFEIVIRPKQASNYVPLTES